MSQLLNEMKREKKEKKRKSCCLWVWQFCCRFKKKHMIFLCAHDHDSVSFVFILIFEAQKSGSNLNGVPIWGAEGGEGG